MGEGKPKAAYSGDDAGRVLHAWSNGHGAGPADTLGLDASTNSTYSATVPELEFVLRINAETCFCGGTAELVLALALFPESRRWRVLVLLPFGGLGVGVPERLIQLRRL